MSAGPVLVLRVQGEAGAQGFADVLTGWRMSGPDRGGWHTLKLRGDFAHVRKLGELLRVRFSLSCCRCVECAGQINTGRDCMGAIPAHGAHPLRHLAADMRARAREHRTRGRVGRAVELDQFAQRVEGCAHE